MKYLITGGAGFIGSGTANKLDNDCVVIDNLSTGKKSNLINPKILKEGDIRDEKFLDTIFATYKPQTVIHLAAQVSVPKSIADPITDAEINITGTLNVFTMCVKYHCRKIVFASSVAVYGNSTVFPLTESLETKPINPYGISKLTSEYYGQYFFEQFGLPYTALRYANVYGPKQNTEGEGGVIAIFVNKLMKQELISIHGSGNQTRDFVFVEDIASATINAANNNNVGSYNVSTNQECSINKLVDILRKEGFTPQIIKAPKREGDITRSLLANTKIKKDFNWSPQYTLETGLAKMIKELS